MADYQAIIDAIDAAVLAGVSGPGEFTVAGRTIKYRTLQELMSARKIYARLNRTGSGLRTINLRPGGVR